jgi:hypothetical protein
VILVKFVHISPTTGLLQLPKCRNYLFTVVDLTIACD